MYSTWTAILLVAVTLLIATTIVLAFWKPSLFAARRDRFLGFSVIAAVAAVLSSVMYLVFWLAPSPFALAAGDALMVAGPAFVGLALASLNRRGSTRLVATIVLLLAVFATSILVPQPPSLVVKVAALALVCGVGAVEVRRSRARHLRGAAVIGYALVAYAVYCVLRLLALAWLGQGSPLYAILFAIGPTTVVSLVAVIVIGFAAATAARDDTARSAAVYDGAIEHLQRHAAELRRTGLDVAWQSVSIGEQQLVLDAYGEAWFQDAEVAVARACRHLAGAGAGVAVVGPGRIGVVGVAGAAPLDAALLQFELVRDADPAAATYILDLTVAASGDGSMITP